MLSGDKLFSFLYLNPFLFKMCGLNTLKYFGFDLFVSAIKQLPLPRGLTVKREVFTPEDYQQDWKTGTDY